MKKVALMVLVAALVVSIAAPVFAGGDKNRGDKGQGQVVQTQVRK